MVDIHIKPFVKGRDETLGRVEINLSELSKEVTHNIWRHLEELGGTLHIALSINSSDDHIDHSEKIANLESLRGQYVRTH